MLPVEGQPDALSQGLRSEVAMEKDKRKAAPANLFTQIGHFVGHVFAVTAGFIILAIPAVGFSLAAHYLKDTFVSETVILVLVWLHYFILGMDAICSLLTY